jgi:hypothetical protein
MGKFGEKIMIDNFSVEDIDISDINNLSDWLPTNGVMDLNIAEQGLVHTLHGQNYCQELIAKLDRWISIKENQKNKAWTKAALDKASAAGHKPVKNREWFAQADDDFIQASNDVAVAKAAKKWFENKAAYFSGWHYAFKTFLKRDYSLETLGNFQAAHSTIDMKRPSISLNKNDWGAEEIAWNDDDGEDDK